MLTRTPADTRPDPTGTTRDRPARRRAPLGRAALARRLALAAIALAAVTGVALDVVARPSAGAGGTTTSVQVRPAPAFSLPALGHGPPVGPALGAGRPMVLSFFASWCTGCRAEMRTMAAVEARAGRAVQVIGIDVNDGRSAAVALLRSDNITYPVGFDGSGTVAGSYRLVGLPTTIFLDRSHRIVGQVVGPLEPAAGAAWVKRLTAGSTRGNA